MQTDGRGPDGRAGAPAWLTGRDGSRILPAPTLPLTKPQASGPTPAPNLLRTEGGSASHSGSPALSAGGADCPPERGHGRR
jgi:hypothetical protein